MKKSCKSTNIFKECGIDSDLKIIKHNEDCIEVKRHTFSGRDSVKIYREEFTRIRRAMQKEK